MGRKGNVETSHEANAIEGIDAAGEKLLEWLTDILKSADTKEALDFKLCRNTKGGQIKVEGYDWDLGGETPEQMCELILDDADEETREYSGKVHFRVETVVNHVTKRCGFVLQVIKELDEDGDPSDDIGEMPNARGLLAQQMRHHEVLTREVITIARGTREDDRRALREEREQNEVLRGRIADYERQFQEMKETKLKYDIMVDEYQRDQERKDDLVKGLKLVLPLAANKLLGGGAAGADVAAKIAGTTPADAQMDGFFESLTDEQKQAILATLNPVQQAALFEVILGREAAKRNATAAATPPANGTTSSGKPYPPSANANATGASTNFPRT